MLRYLKEIHRDSVLLDEFFSPLIRLTCFFLDVPRERRQQNENVFLNQMKITQSKAIFLGASE